MEYKACECAKIDDTGTLKGRGVFATRQITQGEIIEVCPVILVQYDEIPESLQNVVFNWGELTGGPVSSAIVLGWGSMYNHGNPANVRYITNAANLAMTFTAVRLIHAGEELTVNYNKSFGDIHSDDDIWFQERGIEPL